MREERRKQDRRGRGKVKMGVEEKRGEETRKMRREVD